MLLGATAVLAAIPWVWNSVAFLVLHVPFDNWPVYFGPQARFGAFAAGMALAVIVAARDGRPMFGGIWPSVLRVAGLGVVTFGAVLSRPGSWGQVVFHDFAAIGWLMLLASTVLGTPGQVWSRVLSRNWLCWLGLISYSTYMWHEPIMLLLTTWACSAGARRRCRGRSPCPRRVGGGRLGQLPADRAADGQARDVARPQGAGPGLLPGAQLPPRRGDTNLNPGDTPALT